MPKKTWNHKGNFHEEHGKTIHRLNLNRRVTVPTSFEELPMARVLLIEDDLDTGESLQAMLELTGHEVRWAHHGREAMAIMQDHPDCEVILTDILMPEMDGIESIQHFHKNHPGVVIVAMSAQRNSPYLRAAALFGAKVTLHKPFTIQELSEALTKASRPPGP
jgi:DNA-binding NtrC family response regulator